MGFIDNLKQTTNTGVTDNGAVSSASSLDPLVDFFAKGAALRRNPDQALVLFKRAYATDPVRAVRILFWLRDVRGGAGERDIFRHIYKTLDPSEKKQLAKYAKEYGRFDDVLDDVVSALPFVVEQLAEDEVAEHPSLLAKWMPKVNGARRKNALAWAKALGLTERNYRKKISALRARINPNLEHMMTRNDWDSIDFSTLPSQAFRKHTKAFERHTPEKYADFIKKAEKGDAKVNASTLFTYEVYSAARAGDSAAEAMWKNLPDYTRGENALVMADVSGSMMGLPMATSVSLAMYFAERNVGAFNGYFMTFSNRPQLHKIVGNTLIDKIRNIERTHWEMNTNLEAAFIAILEAAKRDGASVDEMPKTLYIISDMQFDSCVSSAGLSNLDNAKKLFNEAGFELPHVVFWNVNAGFDSPATIYDANTTLISGSSAVVFNYALSGKTPLESMTEVIDGERYAKIEFVPATK